MNHGNIVPFFLEEKPHAPNSSKSQSLIYLITNKKSISTETTIITEICGFYQYPQWGGEVESMY